MKILYFSPLENACTYFRCTLPARHLKLQNLADTRIVHTVAKEYFDWADIVVIQRSVGELMEKVAKYCKLVGKKVVYELDDNIFCYPDSVEYVKSDLQEQTISAIKILRQCHAVTATTQGIADTVKELVDIPVYVLSNYLDFNDLKGLDVQSRRSSEGGNFFIGWAGGHYHVQDLTLIESALMAVMKRYPDVQAIFYGDCPKKLLEVFPQRVFYQPWTGLEDFYLQMSIFRFDIGLAPLFGTEFAKSRSPLRLLQYATLGIPTIGSNCGEYGRMLGNGMPGILAEDGEWVDKLSWAIEHPEERKAMAEKAKEYVRDNYGIAKNVHKWMEVYETI
ncbi:MAG TPA: hypothetical protein ACFYD3_07400 [Candidatus Hypogeohydataceae bacterium YC41]